MQTNNRNKIKEVNEKQLQERLKVLTSSKDSDKNPIDDMIDSPAEIKKSEPEQKEEIKEKNLSSLQDRFGVRKINRPVKDAQLTARIDSRTLTRFKEIVRKMYAPDKPNINETVTQIIRAFVEEYDKNNKN